MPFPPPLLSAYLDSDSMGNGTIFHVAPGILLSLGQGNHTEVERLNRQIKYRHIFRREAWTNDYGQGPLPSQSPIGLNIHCDSSPSTCHELNEVLKKSKVGKQPGPDQIVMKLYKWLDSENRQRLLNIFNSWWATGNIPAELL